MENLKLGEIQLNKIYLADSNEFIKRIPDHSIDLINTDPPYEIDTVGSNNYLGSQMQSGFIDEIRESEIENGIDLGILNEFMRVMKKPNIYIWCNKKQILEYLKFFVEKHGCSFEIMTWLKTDPVPLCGGNYLIDKEFCLYFRKGVKLNTTFATASTWWIGKKNIQDKRKYQHPTIKPIEIIKTQILNSTNENDVVADFYSGSGTTAVACQQTNRRFICVEKNKKWHKISIDRLNGILANGQIGMFAI